MYVAEIGLVAMIYIPSFIKDWYRHSEVEGGGAFINRHTRLGELISLLLFFQNKESRLKKKPHHATDSYSSIYKIKA
jgi:hypothetical protein